MLAGDKRLGSRVRGPGIHYSCNSLTTTAATEGKKDIGETIIYVHVRSFPHELAVILQIINELTNQGSEESNQVSSVKREMQTPAVL